MAFLSKCVLQDSSPQIWRRLMELGLKRNPFTPTMRESTILDPLCTVVENGVYYTTCKSKIPSGFTDCKRDKRLFFALSALRDDTDIHQVFIYDNRYWNNDNPSRFWFVCLNDKIEDDMHQDDQYVDCTKATKEELLYHFNGNDDDDCYGEEVIPSLFYL